MRITESRLRRMIRQVIVESETPTFAEKFDRAFEKKVKGNLENVAIVPFLERFYVQVRPIEGRDAVDMLLSSSRGKTNMMHQAIQIGNAALREPSNKEEYALHNFMCVLEELNRDGRVHARQNERDRSASLAGLLKNEEIVSLMGGEEKVRAMFDKSAEEINDSYGEDDLIILGGSMSGKAIYELLCTISGQLYVLSPKGSLVNFFPKKKRGFDPTLDNYDSDEYGFLIDPDTGKKHYHADGTPVKYL